MTKHLRNKRGGAKGRSSAPVSAVSVTQWDHGATGPANRHGLITEPAIDADPGTGQISNPNGIKRARRVDMLEVWHKQGTITTAGFNAAEKLRDAFEATQRAPGWPDNDRVQSSPKPDHAVTIQIDRLSAFNAIHKHVTPGDHGIIGACVLDRGLPSSAGYKGRTYQDGLTHLRNALDRLSRAMG